ncbi:hypothetical protein BDY17DRAFT_109885 [Neohortaea acidophila]|uniref:Uncharacterized protein n=1 Tax=Neohortaea acidophila TaxID=245834 RepID=A0A6A6Q069_9PEZI|nr:uncharacterized protein BDY17DRAFT_109885 [Neohortaea acidophila]KAF2485672.1 hypothetical protein BDY17DRAFT_109885 [Neohortaea acidophila]
MRWPGHTDMASANRYSYSIPRWTPGFVPQQLSSILHSISPWHQSTALQRNSLAMLSLYDPTTTRNRTHALSPWQTEASTRILQAIYDQDQMEGADNDMPLSWRKVQTPGSASDARTGVWIGEKPVHDNDCDHDPTEGSDKSTPTKRRSNRTEGVLTRQGSKIDDATLAVLRPAHRNAILHQREKQADPGRIEQKRRLEEQRRRAIEAGDEVEIRRDADRRRKTNEMQRARYAQRRDAKKREQAKSAEATLDGDLERQGGSHGKNPLSPDDSVSREHGSRLFDDSDAGLEDLELLDNSVARSMTQQGVAQASSSNSALRTLDDPPAEVDGAERGQTAAPSSHGRPRSSSALGFLALVLNDNDE